MILGFSTGAMFRQVPSVSKEIIDICREIGCNAIELNANRIEEVDLFEELMKSGENLSAFEHISLHSPGIGVRYGDDATTLELLGKLEKAYEHFHCRNLVAHPHLVDDWSVFKKISFNLACENMSSEVPFCFPEQLRDIFDKNQEFKMTFDVKHAFESGGQKLAKDLYETFKNRIVEIHLSGYNPNATKHEHKPLVITNQSEIVNFVKDKQHLPIIIESDCESPEQMKEEYEYVKNLLTT